MYKVYFIKSEESKKFYIGITKNTLARRLWQHKGAVKRGSSTKAHNWMRKYLGSLTITLHSEYPSSKECFDKEIELISFFKDNIVNLAPGGNGGFVAQDIESWKAKLRVKRQGRKPSLGMKHTEETKQKLKAITEARVPTYPIEEVVKMRCRDAIIKYGISKTHYLRLRRKYGSDVASQIESNENQKVLYHN